MSASREQHLNEQKVWIVGQSKPTVSGATWTRVWEFQGVVASEEAAIKACKTPMYFIFPATIGEILPDESVELYGAYYPLIRSLGEE